MCAAIQRLAYHRETHIEGLLVESVYNETELAHGCRVIFSLSLGAQSRAG
jgi:hypothetical protein